MVNRCGEQNLAYVMLVQLKGLYGALFLFRVKLTLFFSVFLLQLLLSRCCLPA